MKVHVAESRMELGRTAAGHIASGAPRKATPSKNMFV